MAGSKLEAFVKLPALLTMISSSIEVFHLETLGYLLGYWVDSGFIIEHAIPLQIVERGYAHATFDEERLKRVVDTIDPLNIDAKLIGDYHSHTQYGDKRTTTLPSGTDLYSMIPGYISIIVAVNQKKRTVRWQENYDDTISGTAGDYHLRVAGYCVPKPGWRYSKVKLRIPSLDVQKTD